MHRAAIKAAVERAEVLSGISGVYVKLARRSQVLLHRQLGLLDTMERRVEDPAELEDLFRLDHLTTRMRRHAESLIILSGAAPVRGWRRPVPMLDVVRAAVAEVEDFTRVEVRVTEDVRIAGVGRCRPHPPGRRARRERGAPSRLRTPRCRYAAKRSAPDLALEIEDRGLGMSREALAQANRKIVDASQVDLLDTDRLGLFVVNRLAHRRNVQVALKPSVYGGVTAVVLIPENLLEQAAPVAQSQDSGDGSGPATVELQAVTDRRGTRRPRPAAAEPLPQRVTRLPAAVPTRPAFAPDRRWHTVSSGDGETASPAAPAQRAPVQKPVDAARPGQRANALRPGVRPAPEPTDLPRTGAAVDQELPAQTGEHSGSEPAPLPKRVRQASISPHLRDAPGGPPRSVPHIAESAATGRSPERARATMAALRQGWLSGGQADGKADRITDRTAEGDRPPLPARDQSHSETPSQGDEA